MDTAKLICAACNIPLEMRKTRFEYMGFDFTHNLPACPNCNQVYISEELVKGRIAEVEINLEDK